MTLGDFLDKVQKAIDDGKVRRTAALAYIDVTGEPDALLIWGEDRVCIENDFKENL